MKKYLLLVLAFIMVLSVAVGCAPASTQAPTEAPADSGQGSGTVGEAPAIPTIPETTIRIALEPYYVCSAGIIGIDKGWYKEVGISFDPPPYGVIVTGQDTTQFIASRKGDMIDQPTVNIMGAIKDIPPVKTFVLNSIFYGSIVLGQPGTKTVNDFLAEGKSQEEAVKLAVEQIKGKKFAYDGTASSNSFVTSALGLGGLTIDDVDLSAYGDSELIAMMLSNQVDFVGGFGLGAAQELINKGMVYVVGAREIAASAKPSADSPELLSVFQVGWTAETSYIEANYDTILRFSSVVWREGRFINTNRDEAIAIHLPFMNTISGGTNTEGDMNVAYEYLTPFFSFEDQASWFNDPSDPLYYQYSMGAYIQDWVNKGYLKEGELTVEDVSIAQKVYADMQKLKEESDANFATAEAAIKSGTAGEALTQAQTLLDQAKTFYGNYDFLDAKAFSAAAIEWANYSNK
jgi:ABC-type nitrate/sulfonate/bicarbonate transport system substrate-binding protein